MKEITILSGKGGAGKTSVTAALASVAQNTVFCDNDVDASDLHLIFNPKIIEQYKFSSGITEVIQNETCNTCGICKDNCRFEAIKINDSGRYEINPYLCEGCRLCERICPEKAIRPTENNNNDWFVSDTRFGTLVHARMGPGEENSGRLVTKIRNRAYEIAKQKKADFILNDGPPGIGCSAIASITGTDAVLLVIEPTISGLHDAKRLVQLAKSIDVPISAVINKYNINRTVTKEVEDYLIENKIPIIGKLPFTKKMVESMVAGKTIIEFDEQDTFNRSFFSIWNKIINMDESVVKN